MAIRFLMDREVQDGSGTVFREGEVRSDLSPASERHWISRGVAVEVPADTPVSAPADAPEPVAEPEPAKPARKPRSSKARS